MPKLQFHLLATNRLLRIISHKEDVPRVGFMRSWDGPLLPVGSEVGLGLGDDFSPVDAKVRAINTQLRPIGDQQEEVVTMELALTHSGVDYATCPDLEGIFVETLLKAGWSKFEH